MRIFIAGCARSGTTLMQRLMGCFHGVYVEPGEHPLERLYEIKTELEHVVVKRNSKGHSELLSIREGTGLIYMVRHPYDCMTSYHPRTRDRGYHVTPERWFTEFEAWLAFRASVQRRRRDVGVVVVRYEDLVVDPDQTQRAIADHFGLERRVRFSEAEDIYGHQRCRWSDQCSSLDLDAPTLKAVFRFLDEFYLD